MFRRFIVLIAVFFCCKMAFAEDYSAIISWKTDRPSTSQVEYTEDLSLGYTKATPIDAALVTQHKIDLKGLKPAVAYHYRVKSKDLSGKEMVSKDFTLTIQPPQTETALQITEVKADNIAVGEPAGTKDKVMEKEMLRLTRMPTQQQKAVSSGSMVEKEKPIEEMLIQKNALLLPKNKLQVEPSFTYAHVSANKIAIDGFAILPILVIGQVSTEKIQRDILIPAFSVRYGLLDNLQWNLRIPFRYQFNRVSNTSNNTETTNSAAGIGDIESGLYYQLAYEKGAMPGLIGGLSVKSNTGKSPYGTEMGLGTGHLGISANLVGVKSADPAIIFGNLGYTYNIERDISGFGKVEPGNTFSYSLGLAFALNYQVALNFQLEQQITDSMRMNGGLVSGSFTNAASFKTGLTYSLNKNTALDVVAGWGITSDAPDFTLEVRVPITF